MPLFYPTRLPEDDERLRRRLERGTEKFEGGDFPGAEEEFDEAVSMYPFSAEAWFYRAQARVALNNIPGARKDLEMALLINPDLEGAGELLGKLGE